VREREEGERLVARADVDVLQHRLAITEEVAVREHHALRLAGRAGGVEDGREVVAADLEEAAVELGRRVLADLLAVRIDHGRERGEGERRLRSEAPLVVEAEDVAQVGQPREQRRDLAPLGRGREEDRARAAAREQRLDLVARIRRVDRDVDQPRGEAGEVGEEPLRPVLRQDRDASAALEPERDQVRRDVAHRDRGGFPCPVAPARRRAMVEEGARAVPLRLREEELAEVVGRRHPGAAPSLLRPSSRRADSGRARSAPRGSRDGRKLLSGSTPPSRS
jgi:hypothetical protein